MAVLGQPERLVYFSKEALSGLTDVVAFIVKPDGTEVGPLPMTEFPGPNFSGAYFVNFNTDVQTDENGTYVWVAISPTEGHKDFSKVVYEEISISEIADIVESVNETLQTLNPAEAEVEVEEETEFEIEVVE